MCGRYSLYTEEQDKEIMRIIKSLDERYPGNEMKKGEIYPTNTAPVICRMDGEIPCFAKACTAADARFPAPDSLNGRSKVKR